MYLKTHKHKQTNKKRSTTFKGEGKNDTGVE